MKSAFSLLEICTLLENIKKQRKKEYLKILATISVYKRIIEEDFILFTN